MQCLDHLTQLRLGTEASVVFQPINGHITHAVGIAKVINAARVGNPHQIKVLADFLSFLGETGPLGSIIAVPIETLQHHTAIHSRPTLAGYGTTTALARDDRRAATHVNRDIVGTSRNTEGDINILTQGIHDNRLTQHRRGHPEVAIAHRSKAVGLDAFPVLAVISQLGREREVAHVGILLRPFTVEGHLGSKDIAIGSAHLHTVAGVPTVAVGLTQDVKVTSDGINRTATTLFGYLEALVDRVKREHIFRAVAREEVGSVVTGLLRSRPSAVNRHLLVTSGRTIAIVVIERCPIRG